MHFPRCRLRPRSGRRPRLRAARGRRPRAASARSAGWWCPSISWPRRRGSTCWPTAGRRWTPRWPPPSRWPWSIPPRATSAAAASFSIVRPSGIRRRTTSARRRPRAARPRCGCADGKYDEARHHESHLAVGVPGTVAGLHLAWKEQGKLPWKRLVDPAVALARDGFVVTDVLARGLRSVLPDMKKYPASVAQFTQGGHAVRAGRRAEAAGAGAHAGAHRDGRPRGLLRGRDGAAPRGGDEARRRPHHPRGPEGVPRDEARPRPRHVPRPRDPGHAPGELRRHRAHHDAEHPRGLRPREGRVRLRRQRAPDRRRRCAARSPIAPATWPTPSSTRTSRWRASSPRSTRRSCAGRSTIAGPRSPTRRASSGRRRATTPRISAWWTRRGTRSSLTYTLEDSYGVKIVVPGAGFLLNNEMGDFNAGPGPHRPHRPRGHAAQPRPAGQADDLEHDADDRRQGREAAADLRQRPAGARSSTPCCSGS